MEIADYIKEELGTDTLPEFEQADETEELSDEEVLPEHPEKEDGEELPANETPMLPAVVEPATAEVVSVGHYQVNVEGTIYSASRERLFLVAQKGDKSVEIFVSGLIAVVADARDISSNSWGKVVRFCDLDGMQKELYIRNSDITTNGGAVVKDLVDMGLQVSSEGKMKDALLHYLNLAPPMEKERAICSDRIGWHDSVYLLHDNTVIGESETRVVYTGSPVGNHNATKGTIEDWKEHVAALCQGNSLLILAVCVALSSVLLRLLKIESGGFHVFGESSTGKSTTLYVAASVHGVPEHQMGTWRATANGTEGRAKKFNDALMILDELHQSSPKEASDSAYMIMNGKGKQRANVLGEAREVMEWRLNCLSSGETAYAAFIQSGGTRSRAGQEVRMLDISADMGLGMGIFENIHGAKDSHTFAEQLKKASSEFYGSPIRRFLEELVANMEQLEPSFVDIKGRFFQDFVPAGSSGQVQRVAAKMAVTALAGELATVQGLTGWEPDEAYEAVGGCFVRWLATRGTTGQQEAETAVDQVKNFVLRHGMSRFIPVTVSASGQYIQTYPDRQYRDMAGYRIANADRAYEFIVFPEPYKNEMCGGLNWKSVTTTLVERGYLEVGTDGKPQVRRRLPGMPQARVYHFNSTILSDDDELDEFVEDETAE